MLTTVIPSPSLGLHLQDREFRSCLCYWLGVPLHNDQFTCPECHGVTDSLGDHQVGCGGNSNRISRHNAIRDVVFNAAQSPFKRNSTQTPLLALQTSSFLIGSTAALDVHVIFLLQSLTLFEAARTQGHTLQVGVQRKLASNLPSCRSSVGLTCIALVAETLGGLAEDFVSTIRDIGQSICLYVQAPTET